MDRFYSFFVRSKPKCHPDRSVPGFPATLCSTWPRVRPSVKKGA
jgi:hypothetical protein